VLFGVGALAFPWFERRFRPDLLAISLLLLITSGLLVRSVGGFALLILGTVGVGLGVAVLNVLVPAIIKQQFPHRVGSVMGLYISAMSAVGGVAAWATVPIAVRTAQGWRLGLAVWVIPALFALGVWGTLARRRHRLGRFSLPQTPRTSLLRNSVAWAVTIYMGLQALIFYTLVAWLPSMVRPAGVSPGRAGFSLSLMLIVGVPVSLFVPSLASRSVDQVTLGVVSASLVLIGVIAVAIVPAAAPLLWSALLGIGTSAGFSLALTLAVLRARTAHETARLSAMSQGIGYSLSVVGPVLLGSTFDASGTWTIPLAILGTFVALQVLIAMRAGRATYV
jgi:CP family cyanate transporter-like MFS transporter